MEFMEVVSLLDKLAKDIEELPSYKEAVKAIESSDTNGWSSLISNNSTFSAGIEFKRISELPVFGVKDGSETYEFISNFGDYMTAHKEI